MTKTRKFNVLLISFMLVIAGFLFVACGAKDYSKILLSSSSEYIEMFVGEQKNVTLTIKNPVANMNNTINYFTTNGDVCSVEVISVNGYSSTYTITGLKGGNTSIDFVTQEGTKRTSVDILVRQYSENFRAGDSLLYVSNNSKFVPSSVDFTFDDDSTERGMSFYFYGQKDADEEITLEQIKLNGNYINNFEKVELCENNGNNYLIFTNLQGTTYTMVQNQLLLSIIEKVGDEYDFSNADYRPVNPGEKFAFIAIYENGDIEETLYCDREFTVLSDILDESISYEYGYKLDGVDYDKTDSTCFKQGNEQLILVPSYKSQITEGTHVGETASYITAYLQVSINGNENLLKIKTESNENIINSTYIGYQVNGSNITYYFEINCATGKEIETSFDIKFYYEGFENSDDKNISYTLSVPVLIKIIPLTLLVNNVDLNTVDVTYEFYNNYGSQSSGWQEFFFTIIPEGANVQNLEIDLTSNHDLTLRYKNVSHNGDKVIIDDLKSPVYLKGSNIAQVTDDVKTLPIKLNFDVIAQDSISTFLKYKILKGVTDLKFNTADYENDGIYLDLHRDEEVVFEDIYANATFASITYSHYSDKDVASFTTNQPLYVEDDQEEGKYYLSFSIKPEALGFGTYLITLDNGKYIALKVNVVESIDEVSVISTNKNNIIAMRDDSLEGETSFYLLNTVEDDDEFFLDIQVVAYGDENSTAIKNVQLSVPEQEIVIKNTQNNNKNFDLSIKNVGKSSITVTANGYKVSEFKIIPSQVVYKVNIVYMSYIESLMVYKLSDGLWPKNSDGSGGYDDETKATYVSVYSNTTNDKLRSAQLEIAVGNENAFRFYNPASSRYEDKAYNSKCIYWTTDHSVTLNGNTVNYMQETTNGSIYDISGYGLFDTNTLRFVAYSTLQNSVNITLYAHVRQYQRTYTFAINLKILIYQEVQAVTLQSPLNTIQLSALKQNYSLVAYATNIMATSSSKAATNPEIVAYFEGGEIEAESIRYQILKKEDIALLESDKKYQITINVNNDFLENSTNITEEMKGTLFIAARDWFDNAGRLISQYQTSLLKVTIEFANGTENNRYLLETPQDFLVMKENLTAHYKISDPIDLSTISNQLPLGTLSGSIIGTSDLAIISGIHVKRAGGLFVEIANNAYINFISFEGEIELVDNENSANVGLVAGVNKGRLFNIGVTLNKSSANVVGGNVGGVVGQNDGTILQDFSNLTYTNYNFSPKTTIYMKDFLYVQGANNVGGIAGTNSGTIQKIDGDGTYVGYSNYMAYSLIKNSNSDTTMKMGGLVGYSSGHIDGKPGANDDYPADNGYTAGKGIVVGGELQYYGENSGCVGGAVGEVAEIKISADCSLQGITVRTFIRVRPGQTSTPRSAIIANLSSAGVPNSFVIQAIDDGRTGEESSIFVVYSGEEDSRFNSENVLNLLAFNQTTGSLVNFMNNNNTLSCLNRRFVNKQTEEYIQYTSREIYYGDAVVVARDTTANKNKIIAQIAFNSYENNDLAVSAKNNNEMTGSGLDGKVFFAYYFKAIESAGIDITIAQSLFDQGLGFNRLNQTSSLFPFNLSGEMIFTSMTPNILTIDRGGQINIKNEGLAQISAVSILNTTKSLNFYVYVINYFNKDYHGSIIYPNESAYSIPFGDTEIELRGNNTASLFVVPNYSFENSTQSIDKFGKVIFDNYVFDLERNYDLTAKTSVIKVDEANVGDGDTNEYLIFEYNGIETVIRKGVNIDEKTYTLNIQPTLTLKSNSFSYSKDVNDLLNTVVVRYKRGAISIDNTNFDQASIFSSKILLDEIIINTTDLNEESPLYEIKAVGSNYKQLKDSENGLFSVSFKKDTSKSSHELNSQGIAKIVYSMTLEVNKNSDLYKNRYLENIYGDYVITVISNSNSTIKKDILIHFEQTEVTSAIVDNYTSLQEINELRYMSSSSVYAYPGITGLLEITVNPNDSDFDYILIENDDKNYDAGHASANFGLVAKKNADSSSLFSDQTIVGSATSKGIKINLSDIIDVYKYDGYKNYDGTIYIRYDLGSNNVIDGSKTNIIVKFVKDDDVFPAQKELTIKLQNYVSVTLEGKRGNYNETDAYVSYEVARGLSYKLNINSYGFQSSNIRLLSSNENIGKIEKIGDTYYLNITSNSINYASNDNVFTVTAIAEQIEGDEVRFASSDTKINIYEYVLNYNGAEQNNPDVVSQMEGGLINLQVGAQTTFAIDLMSYMEFDESSNEIINKIKAFFEDMSVKGNWKGYTNIQVSDGMPTYASAPDVNNFDKHELKLVDIKIGNSGTNFYYRHNGLNVTPVRTNDPSDNFYYFVYEGHFVAQNGVYVFDNNNSASDKIHLVTTRFRLNVYTSSSEESPIPIYDYNDFTSMQNNGYYILLNDLVMPTIDDELWDPFTPITGNFKSFDGNGHSITFVGDYNMGTANNVSLFSNLKSGSVIKNLNVYYKALEGHGGKIEIEINADPFNFAGLVAENYGSISNCSVQTNANDYITIKSDIPANSASYLAGIVATNAGYITNSSVSAKFDTYFHVAGFVAQNSGKIAASTFKNGSISQNSSFEQHSAGFVLNNSESGKIITSFVAGEQFSNNLRSIDQNSFIESTLATAGFAYKNSGEIRDCYTDIYLGDTSSEASGFVYYNGGNVKNCFSLSELKNNETSSTGFARFNYNEESMGKFENCYYYYSDADSINSSIMPVSYEGIDKLDSDGFKNLSENFAGYSYSSVPSENAIWFYTSGNTISTFVKYVPTSQSVVIAGEEEQTQKNTIFESNPMVFANGRLELVSPNIKSLSIRNFSYSDLNEETGDITYHYIDDDYTPNRGTLHNPILLSSAENFESDLIERATVGKVNTSSYRLINDIDYASFEGISQTYKVTFAGLLEGNGMTISQITMATMDKLTNGGLFGQIGNSITKIGVVKNLYINPRQVSFSNTTNVGALAGTLKYGYIYDVKADTTSTNVTVTGLNFVGGIIGRATSSYAIQDAYSNLNVTSILMPSSKANYIENLSNETIFSYAGGIAGFVGKGNVYNVTVENVTSVMGSHSGLAFGGVGRDAKVNYVRVNIPTSLQIKAYYYGGFVAGEISGNVNNVYVKGNGAREFKPFVVVPRVPVAVGGVAGILSGGKITNAYINQSFVIDNNSQNNFVAFVGGIVGLVYTTQSYTSYIDQAVVDANILARSVLGGAVGGVNSSLKLDSIAVKGKTLRLEGKKANPYLGGIVGGIAISEITGVNVSNAELTMYNSYCWADLELETNTPGVSSEAQVGGLIGGNKNRTVKLSYCYTTSKIDAKVYDSRALGDFSYVDQGENFGYKTAHDNINEVYYFGWKADEGISAEQAKYFVTYQTKVVSDVASLKLSVNNYGKSSRELGNEMNGGVNPNEVSVLNNLYAGDFKLKIDSDVNTFVYDIVSDKYTFKKLETKYNGGNLETFYNVISDFYTYKFTANEKIGNEIKNVEFTMEGDYKIKSQTNRVYEWNSTDKKWLYKSGGTPASGEIDDLVRTISSTGAFEKDPNNFDIYRRNINYSTSDSKFFREDVEGMTYFYQGEENGSPATFVYRETGTTKTLRSSNGVTYTFGADNTISYPGAAQTTTIGHETSGNTTYWVATQGSGAARQYVLKIYTRYEQIRKSSLLQVLRYKDPNGDVFKQDLTTNGFTLTNETNSAYSYTFNTAAELAIKVQELGLKEIWRLNSMGLTTLAFEDEVLDWTKKV